MYKSFLILVALAISNNSYADGFLNLDVNNNSSQVITLVPNIGWKTVIPAHSTVNKTFQGNTVAAAYFMDDQKCQWFIPGVNVVSLNFEERVGGGFWCRVVFRK